MTTPIHTAVTKLGTSKNMPRVWLEGRWLAKAGFEPGVAFEAEAVGQELVLHVTKAGHRRVSSKKTKSGNGDPLPVIDVNTTALTELFASADALRVVANHEEIRVSRTYTALLMRSRVLVTREGSLFTGGGFLSLAAKLAGFEPVFGVEINPAYADVYARNHPGALVHNCSVEQVPWEELKAMRPLGLLTLGIPCEPYSKIRRLDRGGQEKRDKKLPPEAHELGDMFVWGLRAVEATNPHTVVIEEVPDFLTSAAGFVTQSFLRRLGYAVDARVLDPVAYGELTGRKRAIIVATTHASVRWPEPETSTRKLGEILEPGKHDWWDPQTKSWVFDHWRKQSAKVNGFEPPRLTAATTRVPTIKRRYFAGQGDNPVVAHPSKTDTCRWLTLKEVQRLHGIPDTYDLAGSKTTAGEVIGQGVLVDLFRKVIETNK